MPKSLGRPAPKKMIKNNESATTILISYLKIQEDYTKFQASHLTVTL
jgi:cell fate (sporulation/competence/biofilm development) regulator YlbF (YheA/YmcA/DUF963 family)